MRRMHLVLLCGAAAWAAGCGPEYWGPPIGPNQTAESLAGILESRRGSEQAVSSNLTLSIKGRVGKIALNHRLKGSGLFTAEKARAIFKKGPVSALNILAVGDYLTVYLPWNEKVYKGDVTGPLVEKGSVPEDFHLAPLVFFFPAVRGKIVSFNAGGKHHVIETDLGDGFRMRYIVLAATGVVVVADFIHPDGTVILRKEYARYREVDGMPVPKLIKFVAPRGGVKGYLKTGKVNLQPRVKETAFRMRIPESIPVEEIGEKKKDASGGGTGGEGVEEAAE